MTTEASDRLLDRVRKLLAKAEDESVTPPEAQALTAKAAELMARYGINRAMLAAQRPETDRPANQIMDSAGWPRRCAASASCCLPAAAAASTSSATPPTSSARTCSIRPY